MRWRRAFLDDGPQATVGSDLGKSEGCVPTESSRCLFVNDSTFST